MNDRNTQGCCGQRAVWRCAWPVRMRLMFLVGALLAPVCGFAARTTDLAYFKLVQSPGFQTDQLLFILFDHEMYKYSEPDFSDVRIFDSNGNDLPRIVDPLGEPAESAPVPVYTVTEDNDNRLTIINVQMNREPVTVFRIDTESDTFSRKMSVQKKVDEWYETFAEGEIFERMGDEFRERNVSVSFDEIRGREFRIVIDNGDQIPLTITGVTYDGPGYRLVFQALEGQSYQLFWGSSGLETPRKDTSRLEALLARNETMRRARIGRGFSNPQYAPGKQQGKDADRSGSWVLFPIAALIVFLLVRVLLKTEKRRGQA